MSKPAASKPPALEPRYETTIHIRDNCLCLHARRAARALARHFDAVFRGLGLTSGQFSLLMALNRPEPPTIGSVSALLAMDRTTLTAALKPLERRGLVRVTVDGTDRRNRRMALTDHGRRLLAEGVEIWRATHDEIDARIGDASNGLRDGLSQVSDALRPR